MELLRPPPQYNRMIARTKPGFVGSNPSGAAFTPASLANLAGWWDFSQAGDITTGTGGIITINDHMGSGKNPTQGTSGQRPDVTTLNGIGAAHFVGNDYLQYNPADNAQPTSLWMVFQLDAAHAGNHTYFGDTLSGNQTGMYSEVSHFAMSTFPGSVTGSIAATDTSKHLWIGVFNGGSSVSYFDGVSAAQTLSASTFAIINIGAWSTNADLIIGECGYTTGVMSSTEAGNMMTYARSKWGVGWTPNSIPGIIEYWDFSDTSKITSSGGNVSAVAGQKGVYTLNQSVGANKPVTGTRTIGGLNVLDFNGTTSELDNTSITPVNQPITYLLVYQNDTTTPEQRVIDTSSRMLFDAASSGGFHYINAGSTLTGTAAATTNAEQVVAIFNGASSQVWINGTSDITGNPGSNQWSNTFIGTDNAAAQPFDGRIAFIGVVSGAISSTDRALWNGYCSRWGL